MLNHFHARIAEKTAAMAAAPVLIVALGDSVTHGIMALNEIDQLAVYHHQLWRMLIEKYPGCVFSVINAGVGGDSAPGGLARLNRDVVRHQPDLVIVGYALNDACGGPENLPAFERAMAELVTRIRAETQADVVLLTPNFMNTRDSDLVAAEHRKVGIVERFMKVQGDGVLARYAHAIRDLGGRLGVPVADVYARWEELARRGVDTTAMLTNGLNHPNAEGHRMTAQEVMRIIG
ncbi:MAG: hypothetical protein K8S99_11320 [Planctomycetes bacterium]|nr:hypothetical protein [Planctomycetota bacterium]